MIAMGSFQASMRGKKDMLNSSRDSTNSPFHACVCFSSMFPGRAEPISGSYPILFFSMVSGGYCGNKTSIVFISIHGNSTLGNREFQASSCYTNSDITIISKKPTIDFCIWFMTSVFDRSDTRFRTRSFHEHRSFEKNVMLRENVRSRRNQIYQ